MKEIQEINQEWDKLVSDSQNYCVGEQVDEALFNEAMKDAFTYFKRVIDFTAPENAYSLPFEAVSLLCKVYAYSAQACVLCEEETILFEASQLATIMLYDIVEYRQYFPLGETAKMCNDFNYTDRMGNKPEPAVYDMLNGDLADLVRLIRWVRGYSTIEIG